MREAEVQLLPDRSQVPYLLHDTAPPQIDEWLDPLALPVVELTAAPFLSFRAVIAFTTGLERLSGVRKVLLRGLHQGALHARVECPGEDTLLEALRRSNLPVQVLAQGTHRIELRLTRQPSQDEAAQP